MNLLAEINLLLEINLLDPEINLQEAVPPLECSVPGNQLTCGNPLSCGNRLSCIATNLLQDNNSPVPAINLRAFVLKRSWILTDTLISQRSKVDCCAENNSGLKTCVL